MVNATGMRFRTIISHRLAERRHEEKKRTCPGPDGRRSPTPPLLTFQHRNCGA
jgi:hypothetical protein